jgi:hypothetical protein
LRNFTIAHRPTTLLDLRDTHVPLLAEAGVPIEVISHRRFGGRDRLRGRDEQ